MKIKLKDRKTQQVLLTKWEKKVVKLNLSPSQTTDSLSTYITIFIHRKKVKNYDDYEPQYLHLKGQCFMIPYVLHI